MTDSLLGRPSWPQHATGPERVTHTANSQQTWRQVGWHGQTGAFYALDEDPSPTERGSFSQLWLLIEDEMPPTEVPPTKHRWFRWFRHVETR